MRWSFLLLVGCAVGHASESVEPLREPPTPPEVSACSPASNTTTTFAVDTLWLGESPRTGGPPTPNAWKSYGYDLDGKRTGPRSVDVCRAQVDGDNGIDNAWGATILPILQALLVQASPSAYATQAIRSGQSTLALVVTGLSGDPSQTSLDLSTRTFVGSPLATPPVFDANTSWPVWDSSANFARAYVDRGNFVAEDGTLVLDVPIGGTLFSDRTPVSGSLELTIHHAIITFDAASAGAVSGTIAGILSVGEFLASAEIAAKTIAPSLCGGLGFDAIAVQLARAADIVVDGPNDPSVACDGISIGIGFGAQRIRAAPIVGVAPQVLDPCAP